MQDFSGILPSSPDIRTRAVSLAMIAQTYGTRYAWIGGAGYLMPPLEEELKKRGITPVYSWSKRDYRLIVQPDGTQRQEMYRQHGGWVVSE